MVRSYLQVEIKNRKYGPEQYSGNQTLKDKGFDLKIGLLNESDFCLLFGLRDIAGTGLFSSEYFVLTKKFGNFDITTDWGGIVSSANNIYNPLKGLDKSFGISAELGQGGDLH